MRANETPWLTPKEVCKLYGIDYPQKLSVQLARFGKHRFRKRMGGAKRKILKLKINEGLHLYLERLNA